MRQDFRLALRQIIRSPIVSLLAILTFRLGAGANTAIFSYMNALLLRPLPNADPERLVRVVSMRGTESGKLIPREFEELERDGQLFEGVAAYYPSCRSCWQPPRSWLASRPRFARYGRTRRKPYERFEYAARS